MHFSHSIGTLFTGEDIEVKILPCLTVCPWKAFKSKGFFYQTSEFLDQTFECKEVFLNESFCDQKSNNEFHVEEIKSVYLGRCYMTCSNEPVRKKKLVSLSVRKNQDITG